MCYLRFSHFVLCLGEYRRGRVFCSLSILQTYKLYIHHLSSSCFNLLCISFFFFYLWWLLSLAVSADMVVRSIGNSLMVILPELLGKKITAWFDLVRPLIAFKFQTVSFTYSFFTFHQGHTNKIIYLMLSQ